MQQHDIHIIKDIYTDPTIYTVVGIYGEKARGTPHRNQARMPINSESMFILMTVLISDLVDYSAQESQLKPGQRVNQVMT